MSELKWEWWAGTNEEEFRYGPHNSREDAISEAQSDASGEFQDNDGVWKVGVHIVEACNPPLLLSRYFRTDDILERAEETLSDSDRVGAEGDEGPWFECTVAQDRDLQDRVRRAIDEWQAAHGLVFTCRTFAGMRNDEYVVVPHLWPEIIAPPKREEAPPS